jgi:hypothetical protein
MNLSMSAVQRSSPSQAAALPHTPAAELLSGLAAALARSRQSRREQPVHHRLTRSASHHLAVLRRIDGWSRCRIGDCRVHRHDAGSTQPTIATYCEAAAMITSAWKTS